MMVLEMAQFISITQVKESLGDNNETGDPLTALLGAESLDKLVDELEILVDDEELGGIIGHNKDNSEILEDNEDPTEILGHDEDHREVLDGGEDLGAFLGHNEDHREGLEDMKILRHDEDNRETLNGGDDLGEILGHDEDHQEVLEENLREILGHGAEALGLVLGRGRHNLKRHDRGDSSHDPAKTS